MAGDGRHDSMGHSAKYGAYTMFCCTMPSIVHFELVQVSDHAVCVFTPMCCAHVWTYHFKILIVLPSATEFCCFLEK